MNQRLINRQGPCPPDGFRYVDPVDGWTCHAWAWNDWIPLQKAHLTANGRSIPDDLEDQMEAQMCFSLPPGYCTYDDPNRPRPHVNLGWGDVVDGLKTFGTWIASGCQYVSQDEADRRALICSKCPLNVNISGCSNCHKAVAEVTKNRHSKYDFALKACGICRCLLKSKIHFPLSTMASETKKHEELYQQVSYCWLNKESENYGKNDSYP